MNNKAFTLVELVGVVVILALIFLVTYPNIVRLSKKEDNKKYDLMVKDLCLAGESYIYETGMTITPNENIIILIQNLVDYGLVDEDLKDVKTGVYVKTRVLIYKVNDDKTLECTY